MIRRSAVPALLAVMALTASCGRGAADDARPAAGLVERSHLSMGSEVRLTAWTADEAGTLAAFQQVFDEFDRLDRQLSVWHEDSQVSQLNRMAGRAPVALTPDAIEVLRGAQQVSEWTGGKFDVTFGALSGLWKFDHDQDGRVPPRGEIVARLPLIDHRLLDVDAQKATAFLRRPGMRVHLGGIGKGFAADRAARILRSHRIEDFLVQSGGDLLASGRRGDRPWRAAIRDPRSDAVFAAMDLANETFSTSGDYERFFIRHGRRYHHILDPDTGEPAVGARSVTIVADSAMIADGLSTGVFIMGPIEGMALIERLPDVEGVIVSNRNEVLISSGLRERLEVRRAPTDAP